MKNHHSPFVVRVLLRDIPFWLIIIALAWQASGTDVSSHGIGDKPQLFVDDFLLDFKSNVARRVHSCEKLPEPVLESETPWERDGDDCRVYIYGTVLRDPVTGQFRMWYNRKQLVLYATSEDGLHWLRPDLGIIDLNGSKANNCVLDAVHSPSVIHNPEAAASEQYSLLGYMRKPDKGYHIAHSADGVRWEFYPKNPVAPFGDTCTLMHDPFAKRYYAFHKQNTVVRGERRRTVWLTTSGDLQSWSEPVMVMAPDEADDAQTRREGGKFSQFYDMSAFPYGGQFLGFVAHFRLMGPPARKGREQSNDDGPIDIQLVHSRDGVTWNRCEDRTPVIPNGPSSYDAGCILGVANGIVSVGDEIWTYYTAINTTHGGFVPEKKSAIALAKWRRDGFVSLDAGENTGVVRTKPLRWSGNALVLNADAGELTVAVLGVDGKPVEGYTHADFVKLTGDSVRHAAEWKNSKTLPQDGVYCLEFRMTDTRLYSYTVM